VTKEQLWNKIVRANPAFGRSREVTLSTVEFRRFFNMVWGKATETRDIPDFLKGVFGAKH